MSDIRRSGVLVGDWSGWFFPEKMVEEIKEESRSISEGRSLQGERSAKLEGRDC